MRLILVCALLGAVLITGPGSVTMGGSVMTQAHWMGCVGDLCYSVRAHRAGTTFLATSTVLADKVELSIVKRNQPGKYLSFISAQEAFWYPAQMKWILFRAHPRHSSILHNYVFNEKDMTLSLNN